MIHLENYSLTASILIDDEEDVALDAVRRLTSAGVNVNLATVPREAGDAARPVYRLSLRTAGEHPDSQDFDVLVDAVRAASQNKLTEGAGGYAWGG